MCRKRAEMSLARMAVCRGVSFAVAGGGPEGKTVVAGEGAIWRESEVVSDVPFGLSDEGGGLFLRICAFCSALALRCSYLDLPFCTLGRESGGCVATFRETLGLSMALLGMESTSEAF